MEGEVLLGPDESRESDLEPTSLVAGLMDMAEAGVADACEGVGDSLRFSTVRNSGCTI